MGRTMIEKIMQEQSDEDAEPGKTWFEVPETIRVDVDGLVIGRISPLSTVQKDILTAGNIFEYAKGL